MSPKGVLSFLPGAYGAALALEYDADDVGRP